MRLQWTCQRDGTGGFITENHWPKKLIKNPWLHFPALISSELITMHMVLGLKKKRQGDCFNRIIPFTPLTPLAGFCFGVCLLDLAWLLPEKRRVDFYRSEPVRGSRWGTDSSQASVTARPCLFKLALQGKKLMTISRLLSAAEIKKKEKKGRINFY